MNEKITYALLNRLAARAWDACDMEEALRISRLVDEATIVINCSVQDESVKVL